MLVKREREVEEKMSTYDALTLEIAGLKQAQARRHHVTISDDKIDGKDDTSKEICPMPTCSVPISSMSQVEIIAHIRTHSNNELPPQFACPLTNANGERCNHHISLGDNAFDVTVHYQHKLSEDEEIAITDTISSALRASIQEARRQAASNESFLDQHSHLLPASSSQEASKRTAPPAAPSAAGDDSVPAVEQTRKAAAAPKTKKAAHGRNMQTRRGIKKEVNRVSEGEEIRSNPKALAMAESVEGGDADGTESMSAARTLAAGRRRRVSIGDRAYKDAGDESSSAKSEDPLPPTKKARRPTHKAGTAGGKKRQDGRGGATGGSAREAPAPGAKKKRVGDAREEVMGVAVGAPDTSLRGNKKRKQAGDAEVPMSQKSRRNAPYEVSTKKPKKTKKADAVEVPSPRDEDSDRKRRKRNAA
jgi:hypothetical protein